MLAVTMLGRLHQRRGARVLGRESLAHRDRHAARQRPDGDEHRQPDIVQAGHVADTGDTHRAGERADPGQCLGGGHGAGGGGRVALLALWQFLRQRGRKAMAGVRCV